MRGFIPTAEERCGASLGETDVRMSPSAEVHAALANGTCRERAVWCHLVVPFGEG